MLNRFTHEREKNAANLRLVLAELLVKDNLVLHGHAAHLVGEGISHVLRVCVIANFDHRIKKLMDSAGISEKEAHKAIHREDEGPQEWTKYLFDKAAYDKTLYDIIRDGFKEKKAEFDKTPSVRCVTLYNNPNSTPIIRNTTLHRFKSITINPENYDKLKDFIFIHINYWELNDV
jgi:hypothetical protein